MTTRTTFFSVEVAGPYVPFSAVAAAAPESQEYARLARLYERASIIKTGHRAGSWAAQSLRRLAQRSGVTLRSGYTIARDSKGYIQASRREVV